jgi:uncharacterized membrane protein
MRKIKNIDLDELISKGFLDEANAQKIWLYYQKDQAKDTNRLQMVFAVLGASLVGLGIMLIVAHNWDNFSRLTKTVLAFIPLIIGQIACAYALFNKKAAPAWRESTSVFLVFAVGACIGMVSQIYNLEGALSSFLLTWALLVLPLIYIMQSSITSLLYIVGITAYATNHGYGENNESYFYWLLLASILPYFYRLYQNAMNQNAFNVHSWAIALSVLICLGLWSYNAPVLMWVAYVSLLAFYFLLGSQPFFYNKKGINNPWRIIGLFGTIFLFLIFTFRPFWADVVQDKVDWSQVPVSQEFWVALALTIASVALMIKLKPLDNFRILTPLPFGFLIFLILFFLGYNAPSASMFLSNLFVLSIGIFYVWQGNDINNLGLLNLGLLTLSALIACRFFDTEMSFVVRGILFVFVGICFFIANYQLIKRRKGIS